MSVRTLNDSNFDNETLNSDIPVLVDFYADWCGPCKKLAPVVSRFAADHKGSVKVCKVNIDDAKATKNRFMIRTVPTLMLFKNGKKVAEKAGVLTAAAMAELVGL